MAKNLPEITKYDGVTCVTQEGVTTCVASESAQRELTQSLSEERTKKIIRRANLIVERNYRLLSQQ